MVVIYIHMAYHHHPPDQTHNDIENHHTTNKLTIPRAQLQATDSGIYYKYKFMREKDRDREYLLVDVYSWNSYGIPRKLQIQPRHKLKTTPLQRQYN